MLDAVLAALADPTRRSMVQRLAQGPATTGQLAALFPISRPAVSQHLRLLRDAGLIGASSSVRGAPNVLIPEPLSLVETWAHDQITRSRRMTAGPSAEARKP